MLSGIFSKRLLTSKYKSGFIIVFSNGLILLAISVSLLSRISFLNASNSANDLILSSSDILKKSDFSTRISDIILLDNSLIILYFVISSLFVVNFLIDLGLC